MTISEERYNRLIQDTRTLGMYKVKLKEQKDEIERLTRVVSLRDKEIQELSLLLDKKVEFYNKVGGKL